MILRFDPDGKVTTVYTEDIDLGELGVLEISRASQVEPTPSGEWRADLSKSGGPILGPFKKRSLALEAEKAWLEDKISQAK